MGLELEGTNSVSLVRPAIIVRCEDVGERKHNPKNILIIVNHDTKWNYTISRLESVLVDIRPIGMQFSGEHITVTIRRARTKISDIYILDTTIIGIPPTKWD